MPAPIKIVLDKQDRKQLQKNIKSSKTPVRLVERSKIVLMAADGMPNYQIAQALDIDVNKVGRWRNRYAENGLKGIEPSS